MKQKSIRLMAVGCCVAGLAVAGWGAPDVAGRTAAGGEPVAAGGAATSQADDGITMTQIDVGDFTFDVRTAGPDDGEVVLLLHGFPQTSYEWRHQLRALGEAGFRAVAPDQRGYSPGSPPGPRRGLRAAPPRRRRHRPRGRHRRRPLPRRRPRLGRGGRVGCGGRRARPRHHREPGVGAPPRRVRAGPERPRLLPGRRVLLLRRVRAARFRGRLPRQRSRPAPRRLRRHRRRGGGGVRARARHQAGPRRRPELVPRQRRRPQPAGSAPSARSRCRRCSPGATATPRCA